VTLVTPDRRRQFEEQGFFVLDRFFTPEETDAILAHIDAHAEEHERRLRSEGDRGISRAGEITFTAFLAEKDAEILAFCRQPRMAQLTTELIGPDVRLYWNQSVYKQPETPREFPWHQDNGYTPVEPEQYYTCWLALTEATLENGCIWVLPGSHRQGTLLHEDSPIGRVGYRGADPGMPVPLAKGSMAVFSSLLLHRSGPNLTDRPRKAYIMQYIPAHACNGRTGEPFTDRLWVAREGVGQT
jgi:ectoine hydroxylase-related dioxygenase (phytanoyl-CoA dioxygenase family)